MICKSYTIGDLVTLCTCAVAILGLVYLLFAFRKSLTKHHAEKRSGSRIQRSFILLCFCAAVSCILTILTIALGTVLCDIDVHMDNILTIARLIFWTLCTLCVGLMFIAQLEFVFRGTKYSNGKRTKTILYALTLLILIIGVFGILLYPLNKFVSYVLAGTALVSYIVLSTIVLSLFMVGLFRVQSNTRSMKSFRRMPSVISDSHMSHVQLNMIETMSKYVVLVSIILLSTLVTIALIAARLALANSPNKFLKRLLSYLHINWLVIDLTLNIVCLMTQFNFFAKQNYKRICCCVHAMCSFLFKSLARQDMQRKRNKTKHMVSPGKPPKPQRPPSIKISLDSEEFESSYKNNLPRQGKRHVYRKRSQNSPIITGHNHPYSSPSCGGNNTLQLTQQMSKLRQPSTTLTVNTQTPDTRSDALDPGIPQLRDGTSLASNTNTPSPDERDLTPKPAGTEGSRTPVADSRGYGDYVMETLTGMASNDTSVMDGAVTPQLEPEDETDTRRDEDGLRSLQLRDRQATLTETQTIATITGLTQTQREMMEERDLYVDADMDTLENLVASDPEDKSDDAGARKSKYQFVKGDGFLGNLLDAVEAEFETVPTTIKGVGGTSVQSGRSSGNEKGLVELESDAL